MAGKSAALPKSRKQSMVATRMELIRAATDLFREQGLDGPSLDAICERAGYTRGAFYVHFQGRDDLIAAVMEDVGGAYLAGLFGSEPGPEGIVGTVRKFVESIARGEYPLTSERGIKPHQLLDACARSPSVRRRYVELVTTSIERVAAIVRTGQKSKMVRDDVPEDDVAAVLLAIVIGAQTMMEVGAPIDFRKTAGTVLKLLAR